MLNNENLIKKGIITGLLSFLVFITFGETQDRFVKNLLPETDTVIKKIFALNKISIKEEYEFGSALSENYKKIYFGVRLDSNWKAEIRESELINGEWNTPKRLDLDPRYTYNDPFLTKNEDKIYFVSNMPLNRTDEPKDFDIWYLEKTDIGWSEPIHTGNNLNSDKDEYYITISENGTIYFASNRHTISDDDYWNFDIYYSEFINGKYQDPIRLDDKVNGIFFECDPYISPDESYLIFCSTRPGGFGKGDLYISFKNKEMKWSKPINMGTNINSEFHEFCPQVTKDEKYLFYTSNGDIFKIEVNIIKMYKNDQ